MECIGQELEGLRRTNKWQAAETKRNIEEKVREELDVGEQVDRNYT